MGPCGGGMRKFIFKFGKPLRRSFEVLHATPEFLGVEKSSARFIGELNQREFADLEPHEVAAIADVNLNMKNG